MNNILENIFEKSVELLKQDSRVLGGWHFGSVARKQDDEYSDVDPVFLIEDENFNEFDLQIPELFKQITDECILIWPEEFNSGSLKNYAVLLKSENGEIFQYDFTIINKAKAHKPFCKIFYQECSVNNIIFDKNGDVASLFASNTNENVFRIDIQHKINKYWLFCFLTVKYYKRGNIFHLQSTIQELFHTHVNLLLSRCNKPIYGSFPNQIKNNLSQDKQAELINYFCKGELSDIKETLLVVMDIFSKDAVALCEENGLEYDYSLENAVKTYIQENF